MYHRQEVPCAEQPLDLPSTGRSSRHSRPCTPRVLGSARGRGSSGSKNNRYGVALFTPSSGRPAGMEVCDRAGPIPPPGIDDDVEQGCALEYTLDQTPREPT